MTFKEELIAFSCFTLAGLFIISGFIVVQEVMGDSNLTNVFIPFAWMFGIILVLFMFLFFNWIFKNQLELSLELRRR